MNELTLNSSIVAHMGVIQVIGELTDDNSVLLERELVGFMTSGAFRIELDFELVSSISEIGLRALRAWEDRLRRKRKRLAVCRPRPQIVQALKAAGLGRLVAVDLTRAFDPPARSTEGSALKTAFRAVRQGIFKLGRDRAVDAPRFA